MAKSIDSRRLASCLAFLVACLGGAANAAPCAPGAPQLVVSHAGSLTSSFLPVEALFTERTGVCVVDVSGGSVKLARQLLHERGTIDIFASADVEVNQRLLKPAGLVTHAIRFAQGAMVLAYTTASRQAATIAASATAGAVPATAPDVFEQLTRPDVVIGGSHPFLDPGGYRADMVFQLAQLHTRTPQLYNQLLSHYIISKPGDAVGKSFDYQFTYEHSARAALAADRSGTYRYATLPDAVNLAVPALSSRYAAAGVTMPGIDGPASATVRIPATRVTWGLSIVEGAPNRRYAEQFLQLFFSAEGVALRAAGPAPIDPPLASRADIAHLPPALRKLMRALPDNPEPIQ
jgi:ABC-type molybdate transport system substrate-binding protein